MNTDRELASLTREDQVIHLAAQGLTDKEAAQRLGISIGTINTYWQRVRQKYGATSRAQVIAKAFIESQARYAAVLNAFPEAVIIYEDGALSFANEKALEILGAKDSSEVIGKTGEDFVHPSEMEDSKQRIKQLSSGNSPAIYRRRIIRLDGKDVLLQVYATPLDHERRGFFAVVSVVEE